MEQPDTAYQATTCLKLTVLDLSVVVYKFTRIYEDLLICETNFELNIE